MDTLFDATRVVVWDATSDISSAMVSELDSYYDDRFPNATRLSSATSWTPFPLPSNKGAGYADSRFTDCHCRGVSDSVPYLPRQNL